MTPVLLDQRSIFKAGITLSLGMLAVFFTGYYIGLQKADFGRGMGLNKTIALALPRPAHADTAQYEPLTPQAQLPGADIDVDSPEATAAVIETRQVDAAQVGTAETKVETAIEETTQQIENAAASANDTKQHNDQLQLASLSVAAEVFETGANTAVIQQPDNQAGAVKDELHLSGSAEQPLIIDTASAEDARYTIQVGVFAAAGNAIRRMSELEAHKLSAYTDGYTNQRNQLRFNVRFGYFNNKASAVAALNDFEQHLSGSGYVTRIRRN
jgi:cell division septation protein DedD